ncbi:unnamed protein product [Rhizophagus irregularis]|nr:unnamed protein product [Rhizophagus irregularis]
MPKLGQEIENFNIDVIDLRLPKNSIVNDVIEKILKRVTPPSPNSRIRLIKVHQDRIQKDYLGTEPVERIQKYATLYAEEIPQDEIHVDQNNRASYSSISFHKGSDRIPFKFVIKNSETLANTKVCLRHRLGMSEKD